MKRRGRKEGIEELEGMTNLPHVHEELEQSKERERLVRTARLKKWEEATNKDGKDDGVDLSDDSLLKSRVDRSDLSLLDIESIILVCVKLLRVGMRVLRIGRSRARHNEQVEGEGGGWALIDMNSEQGKVTV